MNQTDLFRSHLRLFFSVDLKGSTAIKQQRGTFADSWIMQVHDFYSDFQSIFQKNVENRDALLSRNLTVDEVLQPLIWKTLGDEILYSVEVKKAIEVHHYTQAFVYSINEYNNNGKNRISPMVVKGAIWTAGFPVGNLIVPLPVVFDDKIIQYDFIGPHIDTGFRLSKLASPSKLIISVELANIIAGSAKPLKVYFDGAIPHKGILKGLPYPAFYLRTEDSLQEQEDLLLNRKSIDDETRLNDYCNAFYEKAGLPYHRPFMEDDPNFKDRPMNYEENYNKIVALMKAKNIIKDDIEET